MKRTRDDDDVPAHVRRSARLLSCRDNTRGTPQLRKKRRTSGKRSPKTDDVCRGLTAIGLDDVPLDVVVRIVEHALGVRAVEPFVGFPCTLISFDAVRLIAPLALTCRRMYRVFVPDGQHASLPPLCMSLSVSAIRELRLVVDEIKAVQTKRRMHRARGASQNDSRNSRCHGSIDSPLVRSVAHMVHFQGQDFRGVPRFLASLATFTCPGLWLWSPVQMELDAIRRREVQRALLGTDDSCSSTQRMWLQAMHAINPASRHFRAFLSAMTGLKELRMSGAVRFFRNAAFPALCMTWLRPMAQLEHLVLQDFKVCCVARYRAEMPRSRQIDLYNVDEHEHRELDTVDSEADED
ncbi:hypothetical protein FVE85_4376 [Porphyridium purpureum]|uniref:Uncharacterized protein n=1 Tax=Porphyridium purpureum TaxID=35688 RepID=A0A5J4YHW4_PORPP|nr:hypothetical protein FVE85_4376 [Porphyridium purpureum]|eukprot:POR5032..scf270_19